LVVTPDRLRVFDVRSFLTGWKVRRSVGSWNRSDIRATTEAKSVTTRLTIDIPSEQRRVYLEAPRSRRATAGAGGRVRSAAAALPAEIPPWRPRSTDEIEAAERQQRLEKRAGGLALTGGFVRILGYAMPWAVAASSVTGRSVGVSGFRLLVPVVSVAS